MSSLVSEHSDWVLVLCVGGELCLAYACRSHAVTGLCSVIKSFLCPVARTNIPDAPVCHMHGLPGFSQEAFATQFRL